MLYLCQTGDWTESSFNTIHSIILCVLATIIMIYVLRKHFIHVTQLKYAIMSSFIPT